MTIYDVVIIGAGFAGLECARNLANSGLRILVIESQSKPGVKPCAQGITPEDMEFIPACMLNYPFEQMHFSYGEHIFTISDDDWMISSIDKPMYLQTMAERICSIAGGVKLSLGFSVRELRSDHELVLDNGDLIKFRYLVGADGSNSIVRRYLQIPTKKKVIALQYEMPCGADRFEFFLDETLFGDGYAWIFPNRDFTSVGCCSSNQSMNAAKLKQGFRQWLQSKTDLDVSQGRLTGSTINYDYRGYRFGNIFLVGDAAGMPSGTTGKGIYPAFISGKQVAREILGANKDDENLIDKWLEKKQRHDGLRTLARHPLVMKRVK